MIFLSSRRAQLNPPYSLPLKPRRYSTSDILSDKLQSFIKKLNTFERKGVIHGQEKRQCGMLSLSSLGLVSIAIQRLQ